MILGSHLLDRWCPCLLRGHPLSRVSLKLSWTQAPTDRGLVQSKATKPRTCFKSEMEIVSSHFNLTSPIL